MATRHHDVRTTGQRRPGKRRPLDPTGTPRVVAVTDGLTPGEVLPAEGSVRLNEGRETATVRVANTGDRPVQVGSHFHFFEVNAALSFDRAAAFGKRLNVPAGTAVRFEPGDRTEIELVEIGGKRRTHGTNGLVNGSAAGDPEEALERAREAGFADAAGEDRAGRSAAERSSGERSEPRDEDEDS